MASLKVFFDSISQPSRAVLLLLKSNNVTFEGVKILLAKGQHMTEDYKKINRFGKVPAIDDNGFVLTESVAILKYLCDKHQLNNPWYPTDLQARARVDEYTYWFPSNIRTNVAGYCFFKVLRKNFFPEEPIDQQKVEYFYKETIKVLDLLENAWLAKTPYLCGQAFSLADLITICELEQTVVTGLDYTSGRPMLSAWSQRIKNNLQPHFDEVHALLYKVRDSQAMQGKL